MTKGKNQVRSEIDAATPAILQAPQPGGSGRPPAPPAHLTGRFETRPTGLFKKSADSEKPDTWICDPFEIAAETVDDDERWGVQVTWRDRNGRKRSEVFPREQFCGECGELRARLAGGGLTFNGDRNAKQAFGEYMNLAATAKRARCVARTGWHLIGGKRVMVLTPDEIFGSPKERVILQTTSREPSPFNQAGSLAQWRSEVAARCIGNSRLILAACIAFAAPLLDIVGEDGGGINLVGASRTGKTTAALVAASVCGGDPASGGARGFLRTWRSTSNGLEGVAASHSDCGLVLDELGQADARDVGGAAYLLSSGVAKARADRNGGLRAPLKFRALFLSTGELGLAAKIAENGNSGKTFAGMEVRLVDLPADPGAGMGVIETIHEAPSISTFVQDLRDATARCYGTAFRAFLRHLVRRLEAEPHLGDTFRADLDDTTRRWLDSLSTEGGQVRSVARRFALIALAGRLANDAGITEWPRHEPEWAAHACFTAWVAERGTTGAREDADAVLQLRAFISRNGSARFEDWREPAGNEASQTDPNATPPAERFRTINRAGWRRWVPSAGAWEYLMTIDAMHEALTGLAFKAAVKVLVGHRFIVPDRHGKSSQSVRPPGAANQRLYVVRSAVISADPAAPHPTDEQSEFADSEWQPAASE